MSNFALFIIVNLVPGKYDEWVKITKDTREHVTASEPGCVSYYFGTSEIHGAEKRSKPTVVWAYEAYQSRDDFITHVQSEFVAKMMANASRILTTPPDVPMYETIHGFLDKTTDMKECGLIWDTKIATATGKRETVLQRLKELAGWVEANEPDTYTFLVHRAVGEGAENEVRILERYASRDGMDWRRTRMRSRW
ncbi:hypothetical protein FQN52_006083 [Onygenales sp. PD_12]|nr:hypothetical protein FQN52_006083 [Onygenales sp. PD_12]